MSTNKTLFFSVKIVILASIIAGFTTLPGNIVPIILGSAADQFNLTSRHTGLLGGAILSGWLSGTMFCYFALHKLNWRLVATVGLLVAVCGVQMSIVKDALWLLYSGWFLLGMGSALPTCVVFDILSQTENQERSYGTMVLSGLVLSAILLIALPAFVFPIWGFTGLVFVFSFMFLPLIPLVRILPSGRLDKRDDEVESRSANGVNYKAWIAIVAFLICYTGQMGVWAFLERIGRAIEIAPTEIGVVLSVLKAVGGLASVVTIVIAARIDSRWMFFVAFVGIVAGISILSVADTLLFYAIGSWIWELFFTVVFIYSSAAIGRLDTNGRVVVLIPGAMGLGGAAGPTIAGYLVDFSGFHLVYTFATVCMFIASCIFLVLLTWGKREDAEAMGGLEV